MNRPTDPRRQDEELKNLVNKINAKENRPTGRTGPNDPLGDQPRPGRLTLRINRYENRPAETTYNLCVIIDNGYTLETRHLTYDPMKQYLLGRLQARPYTHAEKLRVNNPKD